MKQPELGQRITDLRAKKNMTQESLAEACGINTRSLQRIEAGDTMPRPGTISKLNEVLNDSICAATEQHDDIWLLLLHLSSIMPVVIIAAMIWVWKKPVDSRIAYQGVEVINFQISMWLYMMIASALIIYIIGLLILPFIGIFIFIVSIKNGLKAIQDQPFTYPFTIRFLKP